MNFHSNTSLELDTLLPCEEPTVRTEVYFSFFAHLVNTHWAPGLSDTVLEIPINTLKFLVIKFNIKPLIFKSPMKGGFRSQGLCLCRMIVLGVASYNLVKIIHCSDSGLHLLPPVDTWLSHWEFLSWESHPLLSLSLSLACFYGCVHCRMTCSVLL